MKFLCSNCQAKYQIADEKISGRTLRMKCRRCEHEIVISGEGARPSTMPPPAAAPAARVAAAPGGKASRTTGAQAAAPAGKASRPIGAQASRGGSSVGPFPKNPAAASHGHVAHSSHGQHAAPTQTQPRKATGGLGAEFRRQVAGGGMVEAPQRQSALDQWHVAINDVPVGPIRREELARKIQSGAVNGDSLCWREGFDDWRPLRDVPELAQMLRRTSAPAPRVPSRTPAMPPQRASTTPLGGGARPAGGRRTASSSGLSSRPESVRPAARSNVVPIGGRIGATAPVFEEAPSDLLEDDLAEPTRIASDLSFGPDGELLPEVAAALAPSQAGAGPGDAGAPGVLGDPFPAGSPVLYDDRPPRRQPWPVGAWIAVVGAASFGIALAVMVGINMFRDETPVAQTLPGQPAPQTPDVSPIAAVTPSPASPEVEPAPATPEAEAPEPASTGGGSRTKRPAAQAPTKAPGDGLTPEQRRLMEQFGEGLDRPIGIGGVRPPGDEHVGLRRAALDETAIRNVVNRNRRQLQACYEIAIRGRGDPPTVRINVSVVIGSSGTVTRASATGNDFGGLIACLERNVRRWRFPASNEPTETGFPVVFQPGASN